MIDAVSNSTAVGAGVTQQRSASQASVAISSQAVQAALPAQSSPVGIPRIRIDNQLDMAIIEYRSAEGDVVHQYPTEAQIQAFSRAAEIEARSAEQSASVQTASAAPAADGDSSGAEISIGATNSAGVPDVPAATSAEAAPASSVNVTADGGSVPAYSSSSQVVTV